MLHIYDIYVWVSNYLINISFVSIYKSQIPSIFFHFSIQFGSPKKTKFMTWFCWISLLTRGKVLVDYSFRLTLFFYHHFLTFHPRKVWFQCHCFFFVLISSSLDSYRSNAINFLSIFFKMEFQFSIKLGKVTADLIYPK